MISRHRSACTGGQNLPPDPKSKIQALRNGILPYSKLMDSSASLLCSYKYTRKGISNKMPPDRYSETSLIRHAYYMTVQSSQPQIHSPNSKLNLFAALLSDLSTI